jgi:dephospho-CoA kinase
VDRLGVIERVQSIGLTGGIGSGKSTVAQMLVACGAHLVDSDAIAISLTQPSGAAMPALAREFGLRALTSDGALDRGYMRRLVFTDPGAKARLEGILHPMIGSEANRLARASGGRPVVHDVPLLAEAKGPRAWRTRVDRILVVDCPEEIQIERVLQRPGWSVEAARRVVSLQATRDQRRAIADAVITNGAIGLSGLEAEVRALWALWCGAANDGGA